MTIAGVAHDFIGRLPKVELHVHLEGSMQPETLLELATKHRLEGVPETLDEVRDWYEFRDFAHFIEVYRQAIQALRDEEDFAVLARKTIESLAAQQVVYAEITVSLFDHMLRGVDPQVVFTGIEQGRLEAERASGVRVRWIPDFAGDFGADGGAATLDAVLAAGLDSVVGFGVGGPEVERSQFRDVFARAKAAGLRSVPHAGESGGPENIWAAIRELRADRIGHGIACMQDPELIAHLQETQLPLDVSPTSNLRTRVVPALEQHPLPAMLEHGLLVTLNSDDPSMFGTDLQSEYEAAYRMGLSTQDLAQLARNGVRASFLSTAEKDRLIGEIDADLV